MPDREKVIKGCELLKDFLGDGLPGKNVVFNSYINIVNDAIDLLKEQEDLKQKMWNALYAEEDKLEKKFVGTEELHDRWFYVYRPWLQRGFEIAIKVIAEQDGM